LSLFEEAVMAISVKPITLWRRELQHRPGALAESLAPLADGGIDLQVLMAYRFPGDPDRGAVEVFPVSGTRATAAAERGGFSTFDLPALLVQGDNAPGLVSRMCRSIADAGINLDFVVAQVTGGRYSAVFGFEQEEGARQAVALIRKAAAAPRLRGQKRGPRKAARKRR
jgi:hypothetical protein